MLFASEEALEIQEAYPGEMRYLLAAGLVGVCLVFFACFLVVIRLGRKIKFWIHPERPVTSNGLPRFGDYSPSHSGSGTGSGR